VTVLGPHLHTVSVLRFIHGLADICQARPDFPLPRGGESQSGSFLGFGKDKRQGVKRLNSGGTSVAMMDGVK